MPKKRTSRVYYRNGRAWGDFRDFNDVGGKLEALVPDGEKQATTDPDVANKLASDRVKELELRRRNKSLLGVERQARLAEYAEHHLVEKKRAGQVTDQWLSHMEDRLRHACSFLGMDRELTTITTRDVQRWAAEVAKKPGRGGRTLSPGSVRHYLNALSNLYLRAQSEGYVPPGFNPVASMLEKPVARREEAQWLEVHDAALYVEAARLHAGREQDTFGARLRREIARWGGEDGPHRFLVEIQGRGMRATPPELTEYIQGRKQPGRTFRAAAAEVLGVDYDWLCKGDRYNQRVRTPPYVYPLIATFLLTGGRESEVLGLELEDVSFDRKTITFRENRWRRLKTRPSNRAVPLWPQLEEILRGYIFGGDGPGSGLLFPSETGEMITDIRKSLDAVAERAGWKTGEIRTKRFRHTYCAARLQSLDHGAPVSEYTVAREMGHGGFELVKRVYGHLGTVRHRAEVVEYRAEQHRRLLGDRLLLIRS